MTSCPAPILEKKLVNGLNVMVTDHSRLIAADRWYVKIVCKVILPLTEEHFADSSEDDPELSAAIRQRMGGELNLLLIQERNFVDAGILEELRQKLLARISENLNGYLVAESFPSRFFTSRYQEAKKACLVVMARDNDYNDEEDADMVDFSACFRD